MPSNPTTRELAVLIEERDRRMEERDRRLGVVLAGTIVTLIGRLT